MATTGNRFYDLIDHYKRTTETREIARIIELLAETNAILEDAVAIEANMGSQHLTTVRTGLPDVTWGKLYKGIPQSKSETAQVTDTTGFVEALSSIDKRLLDLSSDEAAVRLSEARGFIEALSQEAASKMVYGNVATDPEEFMGLAPRFNDPSAANGGQIIDGGGTGSDNTSIWFLTWGENQSHLIYPEGTQAGLAREDKGEQRVNDDEGNAYYVMEELFRWHLGLTVRDWRNVVRIANVDVSDLQDGTTDIYGLMRQAFWRMKSHRVSGGSQAIYANADVLEALDAGATPTQSTSNSYVRLSTNEVDGREVMTYRTIPVRQVDAIVNTEEAIIFP